MTKVEDIINGLKDGRVKICENILNLSIDNDFNHDLEKVVNTIGNAMREARSIMMEDEMLEDINTILEDKTKDRGIKIKVSR